MQDLISKRTKGTQYEVKRSVADVRGILTRIESQIKAKK